MDVPQLGEVDELSIAPLGAGGRVRIHPLRGVRIGLDLEVFAEFLVPNRPALIEKGPHLVQHDGVALDGRRMVGLLVPDPGPYGLGFFGTRKSAHVGECRLGSIEVL
jgi:hypothetical protein